MEYGDASGTALLDVKTRAWSDTVLRALDPGLRDKLPPLVSSDQPAGHLQPSTSKGLGLNTDVLISAGGGDNMLGAIGTGNTRPGVITASFGTSGTIYACSGKPVVDPLGEIAAFCDSTNRWLPLLCTMNVTVATEMVRHDFGMDVKAFDAAVARAKPGAGGLVLLPYLEGERTPNVPDGTGVFFGVTPKTFTAQHFARAAMEGVTLGMNYGLRRLAELGVNPKQIRVTGGGAKSNVWRRIMADIFNAEVVTLKVGEGERRRSQSHRRKRPATRLRPPGQTRRGHPPRKALVGHHNRRRVRRDHGASGRTRSHHPRDGQRGPAGFHRLEDPVA